jgi:adenosylcobinamide amidohydrolase
MQHVLVIDKNKMFLMPCHPARARELLRKGKAAVYKRFPFSIILKEKSGSDVQDLELKLDPGSKTTTIALVAECQQGRKVVWTGELTHRGQAIRNNLLSRVNNVFTWAKRLINFAPVSGIVVDLFKRFSNILARAKAPLKDAAAINSIRYATGGRLKAFGLQVSFWSGGRTTYNRTNQSYGKSHWLDAVCIGATGGGCPYSAGTATSPCFCCWQRITADVPGGYIWFSSNVSEIKKSCQWI